MAPGHPDPLEATGSVRSRVNTLLLVAAVVLVLVALVLAVVGWRAFSAASEANRLTVTYTNERHGLQQHQAMAEGQRTEVVAAANKVGASFTALLEAIDAAITADNHVVDAANGAVGLANAGSNTAAIERFKTEVEPAVSELAQKTTALHDALTDAQQTTSSLQGTLRG